MFDLLCVCFFLSKKQNCPPLKIPWKPLHPAAHTRSTSNEKKKQNPTQTLQKKRISLLCSRVFSVCLCFHHDHHRRPSNNKRLITSWWKVSRPPPRHHHHHRHHHYFVHSVIVPVSY